MENEKKTKKKKMKVGPTAAAAAAEDNADWRSWDSMVPELLALIFAPLPDDYVMRTVPFVCRAWRDAVYGPYCWDDVNLIEWGRRVVSARAVDGAVVKLVRRSSGTLRRLSTFMMGNLGFSFVAGNAGRFLQVLKMPMSEVTDEMVARNVESLPLLTVLDISCCTRITFKGIELFGIHCNSLIQLIRNMHPPPLDVGPGNGANRAEESEAMAVAHTMPCLQHLELAYGRFSDQGLSALVTRCKDLCDLDIRGCWSVKLEGDLEAKCDSIQSFIDPWFDADYFVFSEDEGAGVDEDSSDDDFAAAAPAVANGVGGGGGHLEVVIISDDDEDEVFDPDHVSDDDSW